MPDLYLAGPVGKPDGYNSQNPHAESGLAGQIFWVCAANECTFTIFIFFKTYIIFRSVVLVLHHAAYLAQNQGLDVVDAVLTTLNKSSYNKKVLIESEDSSVLVNIGKKSKYELVYRINETISDITNSTILEIMKFASSVLVTKGSVYPSEEAFLTGVTKVVP